MTCCWVHSPASLGVNAIYCGTETRYRMVPDDDGVRRRKYDSFCEVHRDAAEAQEKEEIGL